MEARRRINPLVLFGVAGTAMVMTMAGLVVAVIFADVTVGQAVIAGVIPFSAVIALTFFSARLSMSESYLDGQLGGLHEMVRRQFPHLIEVEDRLRDAARVRKDMRTLQLATAEALDELRQRAAEGFKANAEDLTAIRHAIAGDHPEVLYKRTERAEAERDRLLAELTDRNRAEVEAGAGAGLVPQQRVDEAVDAALRGALEEMAAQQPGVVDLEPLRALDRLRRRLRDLEG